MCLPAATAAPRPPDQNEASDVAGEQQKDSGEDLPEIAQMLKIIQVCR